MLEDHILASLYDNWVFERWDTPVSDAQSLALVSLTDVQGTLSIVLEDQRHPQRHRFQVDFTRYPGYRNLLEEYRLELWDALAGTTATGWTLLVVVSPWIAEIKQHESLLDVLYPNLKHYLISTEDDVIEVLSDETPTIYPIIPARDVPPTDKSTVFYNPADRVQIEQLYSDIKQNQPPNNE
jgi:hypothetical protein